MTKLSEDEMIILWEKHLALEFEIKNPDETMKVCFIYICICTYVCLLHILRLTYTCVHAYTI